MNDKIKVHEIFYSIDGEGRRAGELCTFIRLSGCNLRCSYCDTAYAFFDGQLMSIDEIVSKINKDCKRITLTGGEPLLHTNVDKLIEALSKCDINIETNGSRAVERYRKYKNVWFTIDYKCSSSGMSQYMLEDNFKHLGNKDVVKFVVGNEDDLLEAKAICEKFKLKKNIYVSPVFGKIEPKEIVEFMRKNNLQDWRIQLQLHKFIWKPDERGV